MTQFLEGPTPPLIRRGGGPAMQVHQKNLVCVCTTHQNTILLIDALNWEVTYKDLVSKVVLDPSNRECMIHCCTNCPGTKALCNRKRSSVTLILIFNFTTHNGKLDRASLVTVTSACEECKDTLISAINTITKHSFLAKYQANFL